MSDNQKKILVGATVAYIAVQSGIGDPDKWGKMVSTKDFARGVAVAFTSSAPSITPSGALAKEIPNTIQGAPFSLLLPVRPERGRTEP